SLSRSLSLSLSLSFFLSFSLPCSFSVDLAGLSHSISTQLHNILSDSAACLFPAHCKPVYFVLPLCTHTHTHTHTPHTHTHRSSSVHNVQHRQALFTTLLSLCHTNTHKQRERETEREDAIPGHHLHDYKQIHSDRTAV